MNPSGHTQFDVALAADPQYLQHAAATLHSLLQQHPRGVRVHLVRSDVAAPRLDDLRGMVEAMGGQFHVVTVPPQQFARLKPHPFFGTHAWMRMLLPELLPEVKRVLYLDSDTIVCRPLDELVKLDLNGHWVAAVVNPLYPHQSLERLAPLGIHQVQRYFNSGVLLMDLEVMRAQGLCADLLKFADEHHEGFLYPDQDVLNAVLQGRWLSLPPQFNVQSVMFDLRAAQLPFDRDTVRHARREPSIVHFSGLLKPWMDACGHPLRSLYWSHVRQTPWRAAKVENKFWRNIILRHFPYRLYHWYAQHFPQPQIERKPTQY